jgi:hypothetical protein
MKFYKNTKNYTVKSVETGNDVKLFERIVKHIKDNKMAYLKMAVITFMLINGNTVAFADVGGFEKSAEVLGGTMVDMFRTTAKWGCIGMGFKNMIVTMVNGGSMKNAINEGVQYLLAFLFFQLYPQVFALLTDIKF